MGSKFGIHIKAVTVHVSSFGSFKRSNKFKSKVHVEAINDIIFFCISCKHDELSLTTNSFNKHPNQTFSDSLTTPSRWDRNG